ncbi:MAG: hypothetical protein WC924_00395 [Candidatus Gracilibacteria bacterium]
MDRPGFYSSRASALLLSFFMMTMLILVAISVSVLVIRDVSAVRTIVGGTQAFYAAEGMSELGLYAVKENLPGYEPSYSDYTFTNSALASTDLQARGAVVPCEGQSEDGWGRLGLNESVQLALFAQTNPEGDFLKNTSFKVEFYVGDEDGNSLFNDMTQFLTQQDVLRWKILGLYYAQTEAISEYIPLDTENTRIDRTNPSVFGPGTDGLKEGYQWGKYYDSGTPSRFFSDYPISTFLADHDYSYLILTNIIQDYDEFDVTPYIFYRLHWVAGSSLAATELDIFYRLHWVAGSSLATTELDSVVCEYTEINSVADSAQGNARQLLQTLVREGENLPVFDFVLYHTKEGLNIITSQLLLDLFIGYNCQRQPLGGDTISNKRPSMWKSFILPVVPDQLRAKNPF